MFIGRLRQNPRSVAIPASEEDGAWLSNMLAHDDAGDGDGYAAERVCYVFRSYLSPSPQTPDKGVQTETLCKLCQTNSRSVGSHAHVVNYLRR